MIKELLEQYQITNAKWDALNRLLGEYYELHDKTMLVKSSSDIDGMPHGTVSVKKTESDAITLNIKFSELKPELEKYGKVREKIRSIIYSLNESDTAIMFQLLNYRYIENRTMKEISDIIGLSTRQLYRIHTQALDLLEVRYKNG